MCTLVQSVVRSFSEFCRPTFSGPLISNTSFSQVNKRLYAFRTLEGSGVPRSNLCTVYCFFVRPVFEYACPFLALLLDIKTYWSYQVEHTHLSTVSVLQWCICQTRSVHTVFYKRITYSAQSSLIVHASGTLNAVKISVPWQRQIIATKLRVTSFSQFKVWRRKDTSEELSELMRYINFDRRRLCSDLKSIQCNESDIQVKFVLSL